METITVTQGSNGYPSNMYEAIIADSYSELLEMQKELGGEIALFRKRDGWQFYERRANLNGNLLTIPVNETDWVLTLTKGLTDDQLDKIVLNWVVGDYDNIIQALNELYVTECKGNFENDKKFVIEKLSKWEKDIEEIKRYYNPDSECNIWIDLNNDKIDFVVYEESVSYHYDVYSFQLALIPDNKEVFE